MARVVEMWTDSILNVGAASRVNFRVKTVSEAGVVMWHYFGTSRASTPAPNGEPVTEHNFVIFPADFRHLGEAENSALYDLALHAGLRREGVEK